MPGGFAVNPQVAVVLPMMCAPDEPRGDRSRDRRRALLRLLAGPLLRLRRPPARAARTSRRSSWPAARRSASRARSSRRRTRRSASACSRRASARCAARSGRPPRCATCAGATRPPGSTRSSSACRPGAPATSTSARRSSSSPPRSCPSSPARRRGRRGARASASRGASRRALARRAPPRAGRPATTCRAGRRGAARRPGAATARAADGAARREAARRRGPGERAFGRFVRALGRRAPRAHVGSDRGLRVLFGAHGPGLCPRARARLQGRHPVRAARGGRPRGALDGRGGRRARQARPGRATDPALTLKLGVADFVRMAGRDLDPGKAAAHRAPGPGGRFRASPRGWARCSAGRAYLSVVVPRYDEGGFAALPATVSRLLGHGDGGVPLAGLPERAERVVFVLVDAFGWRFFQRHGDHPLLARMDRVVPLTTQFPPDHDGAHHDDALGPPLGEHGLYEWNLYDPGLDALVTPLLFSFAGDSERDTLLPAGGDPAAVLPSAATLYQRLDGVASHVFHPAKFSPSTYDSVLARGAEVHPFGPLADGLRDLAATMRAAEGPAYGDPVLGRGRHRRAPRRPVVARVRRGIGARPRRARRRASRACPRARSSSSRPTTGRSTSTRRPRSSSTSNGPSSWACSATGATGVRSRRRGRRATSSCTAVAGACDEVVDGLAKLLGERAQVHRVADLVDAGWFGPTGPRLHARLADVCVLPGGRRRDRVVARAWALRHALPRPPRRAYGGRGADTARGAGRRVGHGACVATGAAGRSGCGCAPHGAQFCVHCGEAVAWTRFMRRWRAQVRPPGSRRPPSGLSAARSSANMCSCHDRLRPAPPLRARRRRRRARRRCCAGPRRWRPSRGASSSWGGLAGGRGLRHPSRHADGGGARALPARWRSSRPTRSAWPTPGSGVLGRLEAIGARGGARPPGLACFDARGLRRLHGGSLDGVRGRARARPALRRAGAAHRASGPVALLRDRRAPSRARARRPGDRRGARADLARAARRAAAPARRDRRAARARSSASASRRSGELAALPRAAVADRFGAAGPARARPRARARHAAAPARARRSASRSRSSCPESASGAQLERALELLVDRLLARRERDGRTLRAVVLAARRSSRAARGASASSSASRWPTRRACAWSLAQRLALLPAPAEALRLAVERFGPPHAGRRRAASTTAPSERRARLREAIRQVARRGRAGRGAARAGRRSRLARARAPRVLDARSRCEPCRRAGSRGPAAGDRASPAPAGARWPSTATRSTPCASRGWSRTAGGPTGRCAAATGRWSPGRARPRGLPRPREGRWYRQR